MKTIYTLAIARFIEYTKINISTDLGRHSPMKTEKLYLLDSYLRSIETEIIDAYTKENKHFIIPKESILRPEGGGQASDNGEIIINLNGKEKSIKIKNITEQDDKIILEVSEKIEKGTKIFLVLDWDRRYKIMRNHTAEHILFRALSKIVSDTSIEKTWIDEDRAILHINSKDLSLKQVLKAEQEANKIVDQDLLVKIEFLTKDDLPEKTRVRDSIIERKDILRIIFVGDYDITACSGTHVRRTAELRLIKIKKFQKHENTTEIEITGGEVAVNTVNGLYNDVLQTRENIPFEIQQVGKIIKKYDALKTNYNLLKDAIINETFLSSKIKNIGNINVFEMSIAGLESSDQGPILKKIPISSPYVILLHIYNQKSEQYILTADGIDIDCKTFLKKYISSIGGNKKRATGGRKVSENPEQDYEKIKEALETKIRALQA